MIRLTCSHDAHQAGEYFWPQLQGSDTSHALITPPSALDAQWVGSALSQVGLSPFVIPTADHLVQLARGMHPSQKVRLAPNVNRTRAYYEVVVAAPKTISLAALLQPDHPIAQKVMKAHVLAVHRTAEEIGRWMIRGQSRSSPGTAQWLGVVLGHTHSREGDPHLHCHVVVPNLMLNQAHQWRALQVDIAGTNRLRLGLLYGHELARNLRRAGLGVELSMLPGGMPELRSLRPLALVFSQARARILQAAKAAEAEQPNKAATKVKTRDILPAYPEHPNRATLRRRQHLADQARQKKPQLADDPAALEHEARRWTDQLTRDHLLTLQRVLDLGGGAAGRWREAAEPIPLLTKAFFQDACLRLPEDTRQTGPVVFQAAVRASAGRHPWEVLRQTCREFLDDRKKRWQKIRDDFNEHASQVEWARLARATPEIRASTVPTAAPPSKSPPRAPKRSR